MFNLLKHTCVTSYVYACGWCSIL